ncbi:protein TonB [Sphingobium xanthum]|jgi:TonB family protein|uniref:energy transducer TonB n=1 Tax=Sphingobium xanthum TaxID=1387165 RepID=UPI001C8C14EA|nr:energy transducer TonB [Sphingobium xanthum]
MNQKNADLLLSLLGFVFVCSFLAFVIARSGILENISGQLAREVQERDEEPQAVSAITPGPPPALPVVPEGGRPASAEAGAWLKGADYPGEALRNDWQGTVSVVWRIDTNGAVGDCYVVESSGHRVLDEASCRLVKDRARYKPARDANGRAVASLDRRRIVWRLPE